ncbi:MAG: toll/interleukin-1 receptor domain-containing protein [Cytophagales bacterium]|nr:toll/interleukin-1 receptor domain-containing protein [Cytophagales bacterium]
MVTKAYDVFISYSDLDRGLALEIYALLKEKGLTCWIAYHDIPHGEIWSKAITDGIRNSSVFLLLLSKNSNSSNQVLRELEYADKQKKKLFCYKTEQLTISDAIDYFISSIQQIDAQNYNLETGISIAYESISQYVNKRRVDSSNLFSKAIENEIGKDLYHQKKYGQAFPYLLQSAKEGDDQSQYFLGTMYYSGHGVNQDYALAMEWYLKAANNGNASAQNNIGYMYQNGLGVKQDYALAMEWYLKAVNKGNAFAQNGIGYIYQNGLGVKQDYALAMEWYLKAANNGGASAQNSIGYMYMDGLGVKQDYALAMEWYLKAAINGNTTAQYNIGYMYDEGLGVNQDYALAMEWYLKAANNGFASAQYNIGYMYRNGLGVVKDLEKAKSWYSKAAKNGNQTAIKTLKDVFDITGY